MTEINVGVDFGATGLRAAYSVPGKPARFVALTGAEWPWLLCESATAGLLPVTFPSLKSKLGTTASVGVAGQSVRPTEVLTRALEQLCGRIVEETSGTIGQAVISVPARFQATQRAALLEAAAAAGLTRVGLITDSVAAVIGHTGGETSGTFLSYGMGYGGFELGLVRAVRGRYRVLGYEGASTPSGRVLDDQLLGAWLDALRVHGVMPGEVQRGEAGWRQLRTIAEQAKEKLSVEGRVLFPIVVTGTDEQQQVTVQVEQQNFAAAVRLVVAATLDRADTLFEQSGMQRQDVDNVLLVGGSTRIPELRRLISGLGAAVVPCGAEHIARGAALHANQLSGRAPGYEEQLDTGAQETADSPVQAPPLDVTLLTAPGMSTSAGAADRPTGLDTARRLIKEGRLDAAAQELRQLMAEARALLDEISAAGAGSAAPPAATPPATAAADGVAGTTGATHLLTVARRLFEQGQFHDVIAMAHLAWQREPDRPDVFEAMIDLHCAAATANPTIEGFTRDEDWLQCALRHDPSSARIRALLAERIYLHGKELSRLGKRAEAKRVLEHALSWDPDHRMARELLRSLGRPRGS